MAAEGYIPKAIIEQLQTAQVTYAEFANFFDAVGMLYEGKSKIMEQIDRSRQNVKFISGKIAVILGSRKKILTKVELESLFTAMRKVTTDVASLTKLADTSTVFQDMVSDITESTGVTFETIDKVHSTFTKKMQNLAGRRRSGKKGQENFLKSTAPKLSAAGKQGVKGIPQPGSEKIGEFAVGGLTGVSKSAEAIETEKRKLKTVLATVVPPGEEAGVKKKMKLGTLLAALFDKSMLAKDFKGLAEEVTGSFSDLVLGPFAGIFRSVAVPFGKDVLAGINKWRADAEEKKKKKEEEEELKQASLGAGEPSLEMPIGSLEDPGKLGKSRMKSDKKGDPFITFFEKNAMHARWTREVHGFLSKLSTSSDLGGGSKEKQGGLTLLEYFGLDQLGKRFVKLGAGVLSLTRGFGVLVAVIVGAIGALRAFDFLKGRVGAVSALATSLPLGVGGVIGGDLGKALIDKTPLKDKFLDWKDRIQGKPLEKRVTTVPWTVGIEPGQALKQESVLGLPELVTQRRVARIPPQTRFEAGSEKVVDKLDEVIKVFSGFEGRVGKSAPVGNIQSSRGDNRYSVNEPFVDLINAVRLALEQ